MRLLSYKENHTERTDRVVRPFDLHEFYYIRKARPACRAGKFIHPRAGKPTEKDTRFIANFHMESELMDFRTAINAAP